METTTQEQLGIAKPFEVSPVVWALDAFSDDVETHMKTAHAILAHSPDAPIHPVYILSEDLFSSRGYSSFLRAALKPRAHHSIQKTLQHEAFAQCRHRLQDPRILIESTANAARCARKLLRYAHKIGSHLVALGTHGRSAMSRIFQGSFAESLLFESALPVLVVGPSHAVSSSIKRRSAVVIPTSFDESEREGFEHLLAEARLQRLSLHFIHRLPCPLENLVASGLHTLGGGWVPLETYFDDRCSNELRNANDWLRRAREQGVDARVVTENFRESAAESIIDYAKKLDGASPLIALLRPGPLAGPLRSLLRDLVRHSPYPLYVSGHA